MGEWRRLRVTVEPLVVERECDGVNGIRKSTLKLEVEFREADAERIM